VPIIEDSDPIFFNLSLAKEMIWWRARA
jgi:hypothetical protein